MANGNNNRGRGKRPYKGKGRSADKIDRRDMDKRGREDDKDGGYKNTPFNDFSWYNRNPGLTIASASLPFPYRPGMQVSLAGKYTGSTATFRSFESPIPGIMTLSWVPTVGNSALPTDPASIAAKEIYGRVRAAYSGRLLADPPDFVIYLFALDSVFSYIGSLKRIYRLLTTYSPDNLNLPDAVMAALGYNQSATNQLKRTKDEFFSVINELIGMTTKLRCPAVFPMFNRHYWLNDNVYADASSQNSQLFAFKQAGFYKYTLLDTPDGVPAGGLSLVAPPTLNTNTSITKQLFDYGRTLIDALSGSESAYTISGYLERAFEGESMFTVEPLVMGEQFVTLYVPEVLAQIENTIALDIDDLSLMNITQDPKTNTILSNIQYTASFNSTAPYLTPSLSLRNDSPTVEEVVEATRFMAAKSIVSIDTEKKTAVWQVHCATEAPLHWDVFYLNASGSVVSQRVPQLQIVSAISDYVTYTTNMSLVSGFDWHPRIAATYYDGTTDNFAVQLDMHNINQFTVEQLDQIHKVCLYSELNSFGI